MPAKYYNEFTKLCDDCINADQEKAKQRERSERFLRSFVLNLPVIHRESTFENFMPDAENQEMTEAVKAFAVEPRGFLALFGSKGIGKTHLAVAAGKSICLREIYCRYITAVDLAKWLRKASSSRSEYNPDGVVDGLADVPILVLDDLGKERPTEFVQEHLFRLFDCRWANRMATLIISNLGPEDMNARLGEAMVDRITAGKIITIKGRSRRVGNKNEAHDDFA
jgi:DNA replication protein DnaC